MHRPNRLSLWRRILATLFTVLFIVSLILLWRDLSASHLLLSTLNPGNGTLLFQQDIANYPDHPLLTTATNGSSSIVVGLHDDTAANNTHRVFVLHTANGQVSVQAQFSAPLAHCSLQLAPTGQILINAPQAIQVRSGNGHLLWTTVSDQPLLGVHRFQAISNRQTLYTIKSLSQSQVVAYDLHSGQTNWVQTLDDSLNTAPPFLLSEHMLYIASDHNIYALNNTDGTLRWQQPYPSRTLLLSQQGQVPLLLAAGTHGLLALDATTGHPVWMFKGGVSDTLTPPELYQAMSTNDGTMPSLIYTTGIIWRIPQIQEQLWLYAVNARTGTQVWAKQIGNNFVSADAGRLFSPQLDIKHHLVLVQQQISADKQNIVAFDATNGALRWSTTLNHSIPASTTLLETSDGTPYIMRTLTASSDLLWIFSPFRLLLLLVLFGSALMLCVLLRFPLCIILIRFSMRVLLPTPSITPSKDIDQPHKHSSNERLHVGHIALVLLICISIGVLGVLRLTQIQETITLLSLHAGTTVWQHTTSQPTYPLLTTTRNSVVVANDNSALTRLQSLNATGEVNWQTFASEGTFAIPTIDTPEPSTGHTLLVTLSGHGHHPYQFAPDDSAYQHAIDSVLVLYLFDQSNGNILWQHVAIGPTAQRQGIVLGADTQNLYIASIPTTDPPTSLIAAQSTTEQTTQLTAINRNTGSVDWHIFGPSTHTSIQDTGTLLLQRGLALWQVQGIIYAIDTAMGQIAWRHPLQSDASAVLLEEEQQELAAPDTLLVKRLDGIHALSLASGNEVWHLPELSIATSPIKASFAVAGHVLLIYDNGQLQAYDLQTRQSLWSQTQPSGIAHLRVSSDGTLLYLLLLNTVQGNTLAPSVVALDAQTGTTRWTFTLLGQTPLNTDSPDSFLYSNDTLFVMSCINTETRVCSNQYLYALNGTSGKIAWKITALSISHMSVSQDHASLIIQRTGNAWEDLFSHSLAIS